MLDAAVGKDSSGLNPLIGKRAPIEDSEADSSSSVLSADSSRVDRFALVTASDFSPSSLTLSWSSDVMLRPPSRVVLGRISS
jgi:hypothetical protein